MLELGQPATSKPIFGSHGRGRTGARSDGVRELNEARWCDALANALSDCGHAQWVSGLEHESFSQWRWQWPLACVLNNAVLEALASGLPVVS